MICDENEIRCHEACLLVTSFTSCLLYHLIIYHQSFFEVYKRKEKKSSFGCGYYNVYVAQSQERKAVAMETLM